MEAEMVRFCRRLSKPTTGARSRPLSLGRTLSSVAFGSLLCVACGGPEVLGGSGNVCFRSDDCRDGLACVPASPGSSKRICSNDLSGIVSMVEGPPAAAAANASGGASGTAGDGDGTSPAAGTSGAGP